MIDKELKEELAELKAQIKLAQPMCVAEPKFTAWALGITFVVYIIMFLLVDKYGFPFWGYEK